MSYIKKKIVNASEVKTYTKVTKWVFLDDIIFMCLAVSALLCGLLLKGEYNPVIFNIGNFGVRIIALVGFGFVILAILDWIKEFIKLASTELALTDNRIIGKKGFIGIEILDSQLDNFDAIEVKMSLIDRIFDSGRLTIHTHGNSKYKYYRVCSPLVFQKSVHQMIETRRRMESKIVVARPIDLNKTDLTVDTNQSTTSESQTKNSDNETTAQTVSATNVIVD